MRPLHTEEALCTKTRSRVGESTCRETLCNTQRGDPLKQVSLDRRPIWAGDSSGLEALWAGVPLDGRSYLGIQDALWTRSLLWTGGPGLEVLSGQEAPRLDR